MALEQARVQVVPKPWGSTGLPPWSEANHDGVAIGELWFQRRDPKASEPDTAEPGHDFLRAVGVFQSPRPLPAFAGSPSPFTEARS